MTKEISPNSTSKLPSADHTSTAGEIARFLKSARKTNPTGAGRLVFALDATMSRQPTWDRACTQQAAMFEAVSALGTLNVQLVYYRGYGESRASRWVVNAVALSDLMTGITCRGGQTQIRKVLKHVLKQHAEAPVAACVFIGDAMEEDADHLCHLAGQMGVKGIKAFMFQEGTDALAEQVFREIARLTNGAYVRLGPDSGEVLKELLAAIAVYAQGGFKALEAHKGKAKQLLIGQMKKSEPKR